MSNTQEKLAHIIINAQQLQSMIAINGLSEDTDGQYTSRVIDCAEIDMSEAVRIMRKVSGLQK